MTQPSLGPDQLPSGCLRAIAVGGVLGGIGDLTFALGFAGSRGTAPLDLLRVVASGAFGQPATSGGLATAAAGFLFHFLISFGWSTLVVAVLSRVPVPPFIAAPVAGTTIFFLMRLVVLPLSAYPYPVTVKPLSTVLDLLSHVFLFALPIVLAAKRWCAPDAQPR